MANSKGVPFVRYADDSMIFCKSKRAAKLKELTSRSNGWGYAKRKLKLEEYIRGWVVPQKVPKIGTACTVV